MGEDTERVVELFAAYGAVVVRRMFGGAGVFAEGLMIALVVDGVIFLKADAYTIPQFEAEGLAPFSYRAKGGTRTLTSYWRMPERLYDDPDELAVWARRAFESAQHAGARPKANRSGKATRNRR